MKGLFGGGNVSATAFVGRIFTSTLISIRVSAVVEGLEVRNAYVVRLLPDLSIRNKVGAGCYY